MMTEETNYTSAFKKALSHVRIPSVLTEGVEVRRVMVNGSMHEAYLSLSSDRFTLHLTTTKRGESGGSSFNNSGSSGLGGSFFGGLLRKQSPLVQSGGASTTSLPSASVSSASQFDLEEQSIDIGAIARIQRGQVTHKFELAK